MTHMELLIDRFMEMESAINQRICNTIRRADLSFVCGVASGAAAAHREFVRIGTIARKGDVEKFSRKLDFTHPALRHALGNRTLAEVLMTREA